MMNLPEKITVNGAKVAVIGAARSGIAVAELLMKKGAFPFISDASSQLDPQKLALLKEKDLPFETGSHSAAIFDMDWMVISPGVPLNSEVVQKARQKGMPIVGELEVASWFCACPIVAITGSNGKSTVTSLIGKIFLKAQIPCIVAGNIGLSFSSLVLDADPNGVAVIEVSSFQLETIQTFRPFIGIYLNLTPDHLDRHGSIEEYGRMKTRLFENQQQTDYAILNAQDVNVLSIVDKIQSKVFVFGNQSKVYPNIYIDNNQILYRDVNGPEKIMSVDELGLLGSHNQMNSMAAILAAMIMGIDLETIKETLHNFKGLPHRMEFIQELNGVKYYNDSKATNVDSVQYALKSFSDPVVLIAGGKDKDSDFTLLKENIKKHVKEIILIGDAAEKMEKAWCKIKPVHHAKSLKDAVEISSRISNSGDVVLLSPACASFDMFQNFEDRGNQFKDLVKVLK